MNFLLAKVINWGSFTTNVGVRMRLQVVIVHESELMKTSTTQSTNIAPGGGAWAAK